MTSTVSVCTAPCDVHSVCTVPYDVHSKCMHSPFNIHDKRMHSPIFFYLLFPSPHRLTPPDPHPTPSPPQQASHEDSVPVATPVPSRGVHAVHVLLACVAVLPPVPSNISFKLLQTGGVLVKWGPQDSDDKRHSDKQGGRTGSSRTGDERGDSPVIYILRWWCPYTSGAITAVVRQGGAGGGEVGGRE